jgi:hypothetical protein
VVTLDVAGVVTRRRVWWIEIRKRKFIGWQIEDILRNRRAQLLPFKDRGIQFGYGLNKEVFQGHPEMSPTVVVSRRGESKDSPRLFARGGKTQPCNYKILFCLWHQLQPGPHRIEELMIARREVETFKRSSDEGTTVRVTRAEV